MALVDNAGATVTIAGRTEGIDPAIKAVHTLTEALQRNNEQLLRNNRAGYANVAEQTALTKKYHENAAAARRAATSSVTNAKSFQTQMAASKALTNALHQQIVALQGGTSGHRLRHRHQHATFR